MRTINHLLSVIISLCVLSPMFACSSDHDDEGINSPAIPLTISAESFTFTSEGGSDELRVQSSQPVTLSGQTWLIVEERPSDEAATRIYRLTASAYTGTNDRTETLTASTVSSRKTIMVTQLPTDALLVNTTSVNRVPSVASTMTVEVAANGDYRISTDASWLRLNEGSRANMQTRSHTFTVDANTGAERSATITFSLNNLMQKVTVIQDAAKTDGTGTTAWDIAARMYPGWNLGNTMEATGSGLSAETAWQKTKTTQAVIDFVKAQGFRSVRIPCSWFIHSTNGIIDPAWMNRVKEVVDYCIADGLYVLLNDHWDSGWIEVDGFTDLSESNQQAKEAMLKNLWTQIATAFSTYDEHLLFGGLNEPNADSQTKTNALMRYHQAFIDAVRATGGNNATRTLVLQGPNTNIDNTCRWLDMSKIKDPANTTANDHLMIEVHYYDPAQFSGVWENGHPYWFWGNGNHVSGSDKNSTWGEEDHLKSQFLKMKTTFADKGYPIILGEFGANWRNIGTNQDRHDASIKLFHKMVVQTAIESGMIPMVWDINVASQQGVNGIMTVIDRSRLSVFGTPAMEGITEGTAAAKWYSSAK